MKHAMILIFTILFGSSLHAVDTASIDAKTQPCSDFFEYANGAWLANNSIPADRTSWGAFSEIDEKNLGRLHEILEDAARNTSAAEGSIGKKVGDFYRSGMNEKKIEWDGIKSLEDELQRIASINDVTGLQTEIARLHRRNVSPAFNVFVSQDFKDSTRMIAWLYQGGLGLPDRDYYTSDDPKMKEIRKQYVDHVAKMFELMGDNAATARSEADTIMGLEDRLARVSMTQVEQRDPQAIDHKMTLADLQSQCSACLWSTYFQNAGLADPGTLNVSQPEFFRELNKMITGVNLNDWKTYLRWNLINATAPYLSSAFVQEDFHFNSEILFGTKEMRPRWKRVLSATDQRIGHALGQLYVAKYFPPEAKARANELVSNLISALRDRMKVLDWIDDGTRKRALEKVDAIVVKIGYPDKWRDYSTLPINQKSYVENILQADEFEFQRNLNKIGKPVDPSEWGMTPSAVNAYYNPSFNEIVFPAGILQPPFFDPDGDDAANYGAIGSVIGHELTHGFDDQGHQFDADGNLKNWWSSKDEAEYASRASVIDKQYSEYTVVDGLKINGKLTLGENIADLGGLKIAYLAFQKTDAAKQQGKDASGYTADQRFFLAFAQGWRRNIRPETLRVMLATDPHSPARFRVIGTLANMPEFHRAFSCSSSSGGSSPTVAIW